MHPIRVFTLSCLIGVAPALAQTSAPPGPAGPSGRAGATPATGPGATPAPAAAGADAVPALRVAVTQVRETRTSARGSVTLTMTVAGDGLPPTAVIRQVNVTGAVDNKGRTVGPSPTGGRGSNLQSTLGMGRGSLGGVVQYSVSLGGTLRDAESLRFVEGTIELFMPTETNGAMVRIPNILSHPGRLEDPALVKHGIEFRFFGDAASFAQGQKDVAPPSVPGGGTIGLIGSPLGAGGLTPNFPLGAGYFVRDPSGRYAAHQLQAADGTPIVLDGWSTSGSATSGSSGQVDFSAPLPPNAQLVLYLMVPEALKTVPFRVEEILLP